MAGVAGRSGRKGWEKERDSKRLWEASVPIVLRYLNSNASLAAKTQVALELLKKMMPVAVDHSGRMEVDFSMVEALRRAAAARIAAPVIESSLVAAPVIESSLVAAPVIESNGNGHATAGS